MTSVCERPPRGPQPVRSGGTPRPVVWQPLSALTSEGKPQRSHRPPMATLGSVNRSDELQAKPPAWRAFIQAAEAGGEKPPMP